MSITLPAQSSGNRRWVTTREAEIRDDKIAMVQKRVSFFIYTAHESIQRHARDTAAKKPGSSTPLRKSLIQDFRRCQYAIAIVEFTNADLADLRAAMTEYIELIHERFVGEPGWAKLVSYTRGPADTGLVIWTSDDPARKAWTENQHEQRRYDENQLDFDDFENLVAYPCTVPRGRPPQLEDQA